MALQSGMTYKEFWEEDPEMFWAYCFYFYKKQRIDLDDANFKAWLNGLYVYNAVATSLANSFRGKNDKSIEYLGQPLELDLCGKEKTKEENKQELSALDLSIKARAEKMKQILNKKKAIE